MRPIIPVCLSLCFLSDRQDCTHILVCIRFPGATMADLDLEVTRQQIIAESSALRLATYLPFPVQEKQGNAKWDARTDTLTVTLPIIRPELF